MDNDTQPLQAGFFLEESTTSSRDDWQTVGFPGSSPFGILFHNPAVSTVCLVDRHGDHRLYRRPFTIDQPQAYDPPGDDDELVTAVAALFRDPSLSSVTLGMSDGHAYALKRPRPRLAAVKSIAWPAS